MTTIQMTYQIAKTNGTDAAHAAVRAKDRLVTDWGNTNWHLESITEAWSYWIVLFHVDAGRWVNHLKEEW